VEERENLTKVVFKIRAWESIYIMVWRGLLGNHRGLARVNYKGLEVDRALLGDY
jgi:hypothetical protein